MDRSILVSLPTFRIEVNEDGKTVRTITKCSFGRDGHRTPLIRGGCLSPTKRDRNHHSSIYNGASMPFALFFEQDPTCAFHEGNPAVASHGCIHLTQEDAAWLFDWAGNYPVRLDIEGPYPSPPIAPGAASSIPIA